MKLIRWGFGVAVGTVLLAIVIGLGYRSFKQAQISAAIRITTPGGIESLELIEINGSQQWVKIRGHDTDNPILLYLHGGPGMPEMAVSHLSDLELEKHFTVVHWDQRGSGKTRRQGVVESQLTVPVFVQDTLELVEYLRSRFNQDKIYLVGHSWGSMLGILVVRDHPELFHAYVGMGQVTNLALNEEVSLDYVTRAAKMDLNIEALEELAGLEPPYVDNHEQLSVERKWLYFYGGGVRGLGYDEILLAYLTSPDYSLLDLAAMLRGLDISKTLWPQMMRYDFVSDARSLALPVYFFAGWYDYNTPSMLAKNYFEVLSAPHKEFFWFENSAHLMNWSDPERYQDLLINHVLQRGQGHIDKDSKEEKL